MDRQKGVSRRAQAVMARACENSADWRVGLRVDATHGSRCYARIDVGNERRSRGRGRIREARRLNWDVVAVRQLRRLGVL